MGNDALEKILEAARLPLESLIAAIRPDAPAPEIDLQRVKHLGAICVWLTEKLGLTSQPATSFARGEMETVKQPSPSA